MELERCPQGVRDLAAEAACPKCGTKRGAGIVVKVSFQQPCYFVVCTCLRCGCGPFGWTLMGPAPAAAPEPFVADPALTKPDWYSHVEIAENTEESR